MENKIITSMYGGDRLDVFLSKELSYTRSKVKKLIDQNLVEVNGKIKKASYEVDDGDTIIVNEGEPQILDLQPVNMPLNIIYQDTDIAVINKPQGLTVHAGNGVNGYTLVNLLLYHLDSLSGINGVIRPGIVHRIDKDTSGLLVVAKNDNAHLSLQKQIAEKTCKREYLALLNGKLKEKSGVIETFIDRSKVNRTMMAVSTSGRKAITNYKVLKEYKDYSLVQFNLQTGRTHQIRVHAKHLGCPIVGDAVYGFKACKFNLNGQLLHAQKLTLTHPTTNKVMEFTAPIPDYFQNVLDKLK